MGIAKPFQDIDRDLPVRCAGCGWRSMMRHAKAVMNDLVRCPECNQPVEVEEPPKPLTE